MIDPWKDLQTPDRAPRISALRVDESLPWNFFWAKDADRKCLLVVRHDNDSAPSSRLPTLNGLEIDDRDNEDGSAKILVFKLVDTNQRVIFQQLCLDIISATQPAKSEAEAVDLALTRTWRWHHLLRGGSSGLLSVEEQKGLIGELIFLEEHLLRQFSPADTVEAWHGPLGAPKDFEVGRVCIEAKARRGAAAPFVAISSEHQLDATGLDALFLHVVNLSSAPATDAAAFTLSDIALRISRAIEATDQASFDVFNSRLFACGFDWDQDYASYRWVLGPSQLFHVSDGFPALTATDMPSGVSNVRYSISLLECGAFVAGVSDLDKSLHGAAHGN